MNASRCKTDTSSFNICSNFTHIQTKAHVATSTVNTIFNVADSSNNIKRMHILFIKQIRCVLKQ